MPKTQRYKNNFTPKKKKQFYKQITRGNMLVVGKKNVISGGPK